MCFKHTTRKRERRKKEIASSLILLTSQNSARYRLLYCNFYIFDSTATYIIVTPQKFLFWAHISVVCEIRSSQYAQFVLHSWKDTHILERENNKWKNRTELVTGEKERRFFLSVVFDLIAPSRHKINPISKLQSEQSDNFWLYSVETWVEIKGAILFFTIIAWKQNFSGKDEIIVGKTKTSSDN